MAIKFGINHINKTTPQIVNIICNGINSILVFTAGYQAFANEPMLVFYLMLGGLVIDKFIRPLFGDDNLQSN